MTACPGWMAAILIDTQDFSPETGGIALGDSPNIESYYAVGFNSTRRALLNSETSMSLNSFRYGDAAEGLMDISDRASNVECVVLLGGFNSDEDPWVDDDHVYGFVPTEMKLGNLVAAGVSVTSPYDGVVAATGDTPQGAQWFESEIQDAGSTPVVFIDEDSSGNVVVAGSIGDSIAALILVSEPDANNGSFTIENVDGDDIDIDEIDADSNGCMILNLGVMTAASHTLAITFNNPGAVALLRGYIAALEAVE